MMNSWYNKLAVCVIINSITIVLGLSCNSTQKLRLDSGGQSICCFTTICDKGEQFQLCNSHNANDTCMLCPHGYTTGIVIDTELVESHFNQCILPLCKDGAALINGSCVCDTYNGFFGNKSDSCVFKQCDYGYILTYQGICEECINGQPNCTVNNTGGISDSNRDQSSKDLGPSVLAVIVLAFLALVILISVFVYKRFLKRKRMCHFSNDTNDYAYADEIIMTSIKGKSSPETRLEGNFQKVCKWNHRKTHYTSPSVLEREQPLKASPLPIRIHVPDTETHYLDGEDSILYTCTDDNYGEYRLFEQDDVSDSSLYTTYEEYERPNENREDSVDSSSSLTLPKGLMRERENQSGPYHVNQTNGSNAITNTHIDTSFNINTNHIHPLQIPYASGISLSAVPFRNGELDEIESAVSSDGNASIPHLTFPKGGLTNSNQQVRTDMMDEPFRHDKFDEIESAVSSYGNASVPQLTFPEREQTSSYQQVRTDMINELARNDQELAYADNTFALVFEHYVFHQPVRTCSMRGLQTESSSIIRMIEQLKVKREDRGKACEELQKEINKIQQEIDRIKPMLTGMLSSGNQEESNQRGSERREIKDEDNSVIRTIEEIKSKLASEEAEYRRLEKELNEKKHVYNQATMMMTEILRSYDTDDENRSLDYEQHGACGIDRNDANSTVDQARSKVYYAAGY